MEDFNKLHSRIQSQLKMMDMIKSMKDSIDSSDEELLEDECENCDYQDEMYAKNIGKYVLVVSLAGDAHVGILTHYDPENTHAVLVKSRKICMVGSDNDTLSLYHLAANGFKLKGEKFSIEIPMVMISGVMEVIQVSESVAKQLRQGL